MIFRNLKRLFLPLTFLILALIFIPIALNGQTNDISSSDLSKIKVDEISDEQIQIIVEKSKSSGYTQQQMEAAALAKGMSQTELAKLRKRMNSVQTGGAAKMNNTSGDRSRTVTINKEGDLDLFDLLNDSLKMDHVETVDPRSRIFGFSLFNSANLSFEPSVNIPSPVDYQLGPGDELLIDIWGASQQNYQLKISPDGFIIIDNIGPVAVSGLTIEAASSKLVNRLTSIYSGLKGPNPNTFAQVSLGNLRSIKVVILGEVNLPGSYTLSSFSTAFNALYLSGGPNINGSLRDIEIIRNNKLISKLDVYDFLLNGDKSIDLRLNDQDIVKVNPYSTRVKLSGEVKRPAIYEMKSAEYLIDLIDFAGGFSDKAYTHRIKIYRSTSREKQLLDVPSTDFPLFSLENGDSLVVEPILSRFENRVEIRGAVFRSGEYSLTEGLTLLELLDKADGLRGDAFLSRAIIYRTRPDFTIETISVDISALIDGKSEDILLKREDIVFVSSIFDLKEEYFVQIDGEVQEPGNYPFTYNSSLEDVIIMAGGLQESAYLAKIEIARRVKDNMSTTSSIKVAEIYNFPISKDLRLSDSASLFKLEPFDRVFVRRSPGYVAQASVRVDGEVTFPGEYSIASKEERISDLINRSGGLTLEAFPKGAKLERYLKVDQEERLKTLENLSMQSKDSLLINPIATNNKQTIGIDLVKIMEEPRSKYDLLLQEGDKLLIPKQLQTVKLSGSLLYPVTVRYDKRYSFIDYVNNAGGYADNAKKTKSYVLYANGSVDRTRSFLTIKNYPRVEPGAEIIVPNKDVKRRMTTGEILGFGSAMASFALIVVTIANSFNP